MKRVLFCLTSLTRTNGIAKFIMSYYPHVINKVNIDFLLAYNTIDNKYKEIIEKGNGKIYVINCKNKLIRATNTAKKICQINKINRYDVIHINFIQQYALGCVIGAKISGINKIIYHAHSPIIYNNLNLIRKLIGKLCVQYSNCLVACSNSTGISNFGRDNYIVMRNALNFKEYKYCLNDRNKYLKEFGLKNKFIIGVVGRICEAKNPDGILSILQGVLKIKPNSIILWIGSGEEKFESKLKKQISSKNLEKNFLLVGSRQDVNRIYSCFDIFLLPSLYEGLGIVFLEAQAAGLPTFASSNVPKDVKCTDLINFITYNNNIDEWVNSIINCKSIIDREKYNEIMCNSDFSIEKNMKTLLQLYEDDIDKE